MRLSRATRRATVAVAPNAPPGSRTAARSVVPSSHATTAAPLGATASSFPATVVGVPVASTPTADP